MTHKKNCRLDLAIVISVMAIATLTIGAPLIAAEASGEAPQSSVGLEEIVVTAQRRSETAQSAAAAITALSGDSLAAQGIVDSRGLQKVLPSVEIKPEGAVSQTFIRGVGNNIDLPYTDPAVAYNVNGIFLPRYATASAFFDLERVEVLPGPQGTLYGGAAAGGVINLVARTPDNNYDGEAMLEGGNYSLLHAFVAQNIPLGETVSLRAAVDYEKHTGYETNGFGSDNRTSGRLSLLWKPQDDVKVLAWAQAFNDSGKPLAAVFNTLGNPAFSSLIDPRNPWYIGPTGLAGNPVNPEVAKKDYRNYAFGGRLDWDFDGLTLSYLPGYILLRNESLFYAAYFPLTVHDYENQLTQELKLANDSSLRFSWIAGLYFSHTDITFDEVFFGAPVLIVPKQVNKSYAAYAQGTFKFTDRIRLTVGARESSDGKMALGSTNGLGFATDFSHRNTDFKVALEADVAEKVLVYGAVQSGFLPGGYSPAPNTATFNNEVKPEKLRSYTAGVKSRLFNDKLTLNNEVYYYDYKNYQVVAINVSTGLSNVFSAQKATIYGDQLNIAVQPTPEDTVTVGLGLLSAKYDEFVIPGGMDFSGNRLTDSAKVTASIGEAHVFGLPNGGNITADVHYFYDSGYFGQYQDAPEFYQGHFSKTDASVTYNAPAKDWSVRAWVLNAANKAVLGAHAAVFPGLSSAFIDPPRTYGLSVTRKW